MSAFNEHLPAGSVPVNEITPLIVEQFMDAICDGGTPVADCDLCGKTWYAADGDLMEDGELARLRAKHEASPDKYASTDASSVSYGHAFGRQWVWECRCEKGTNIITELWSHRGLLLRAFGKVRDAQAKEAARFEQDMKQVL